MKNFIFLIFIFSIITSKAQTKVESVMSLSEYLGYVKKYHPIVKQANLIISESEAKLLKSRGAFDPKIEIDFDKKQFKDKNYYNKLNATFKIPTWYGIELKANFEENDGLFLNPENNVPIDGLYAAGVSVSVLKGLLINNRMALLKQAKVFIKQAREDQQIEINKTLYNASIAYFNWLKTYNEKLVYQDFLLNANNRFTGTKKQFSTGYIAAIDTLEARITLQNRKLNLEKARIKLVKASLQLSNFLWLNENTPIVLQPTVIPDITLQNSIDSVFNLSTFNQENFDIENHPKIKSLGYKIESLKINRNLQRNNLLPDLDLQYNFLSQTPNQFNSFNSNNYKAGITFKVPLFLRKERGELKLATIKLSDSQFETQSAKAMISNKINAINQEIESFDKQNLLTNQIVNDYQVLLKAEERKFFLGESSLFLVNSRESKLIDSKLKAIELQNSFFKTKANLFKTVVILILDDKQ